MVKLYNILIFTLCVSLSSFAQERSVFGRVIDSTRHEGINNLIIQNKTSGQLVNTNHTGEFFIRALPGDSIFIADIGYERAGTIFDGKNKYPVIATILQPQTLKEVVIIDKRRQELQEEIEEFLRNPQSGGTIRQQIIGNLLNTNTTQPGIGISIDGLYSLWSKEGKLDRKVADLKYQDIKGFYVNLKYNRALVAQITKLEDFEIDDFMKFCKPSEDFILRANDYDLTSKTLNCLNEYRTSRIFRKTR